MWRSRSKQNRILRSLRLWFKFSLGPPVQAARQKKERLQELLRKQEELLREQKPADKADDSEMPKDTDQPDAQEHKDGPENGPAEEEPPADVPQGPAIEPHPKAPEDTKEPRNVPPEGRDPSPSPVTPKRKLFQSVSPKRDRPVAAPLRSDIGHKPVSPTLHDSQDRQQWIYPEPTPNPDDIFCSPTLSEDDPYMVSWLTGLCYVAFSGNILRGRLPGPW